MPGEPSEVAREIVDNRLEDCRGKRLHTLREILALGQGKQIIFKEKKKDTYHIGFINIMNTMYGEKLFLVSLDGRMLVPMGRTDEDLDEPCGGEIFEYTEKKK